jgi:UDP-glucose:(heptosyl)LPS alpha-1,3-glucosyltransferase
MKIALIRQRYNPFGGAERFVEQALASLRAQDDLSLTLIARHWDSDGSGTKPGLELCTPVYVGRTWRDWSFARAACSRVRSVRFDLVQSHERIACCDIYRAGDGVHAQWLENRARSLGFLGRLGQRISPWHRYTLAAERRLFGSPRLKVVVCNSRMVANEVKARFAVADEKIRVIYNGVNLERFHPGLRARWRREMRERLGIPQDARVLLFLGSGFERKGAWRLLDALSELAPHREDIHLVVVGADRHIGRFRASCSARGLHSRVRVVGPQTDTAPWYGMADAYVLPTLYDPFPNAALEAMASGLPVVTSTQCGVAELLEDQPFGFACDALDVRALVQKLSALDTVTLSAMGLQARIVAERHSQARMIEQLRSLYEELLVPSEP